MYHFFQLLINILKCIYFKFNSYKEQSADETDSEDLIEIEYNDTMMEEEIAETIEKVLDHRIGKKGGMIMLMFIR